jgi:hypothetical protein
MKIADMEISDYVRRMTERTLDSLAGSLAHSLPNRDDIEGKHRAMRRQENTSFGRPGMETLQNRNLHMRASVPHSSPKDQPRQHMGHGDLIASLGQVLQESSSPNSQQRLHTETLDTNRVRQSSGDTLLQPQSI